MRLIDFNNIDDLTNNFNQNGWSGSNVVTYYIQSPIGGISGGDVLSYSGQAYYATAVYNKQSYDILKESSGVYESMDILYNGSVQPLAPGVNSVRSFRLGVVDSASSTFETFGNASVYIEGDYSLTDNSMVLVGRSATNNVLTSLALGEVKLTANDWYRIDATVTNKGNGQVELSGALVDLGPNGNNAPIAVAAFDWTYTNQPIATSSSLYAGFSGLADGGIPAVDNFSVDTAPLCFMAGTRLRTPEGDVAIETLKRGDPILTAEGAISTLNWLGKQTISTVFADALRVLPIRVRAGALEENVPMRDLLVSPDHALLVEGVLVHAGALVNGTSIVREANVPEVFIYYHVELDDHSLILAENVPAETFIDNVDRMNFDNWAEFEALYPEGRAVKELPYPRAKAMRQLPQSIRAALDHRATEAGSTMPKVA